MEILFILLVFIVEVIMAYSLPVQIEEYALELGLDYDSINCLYKTMRDKEEKAFVYRGKKFFLLKIFFKNYKVDPHRTVLESVFFFNYYFYISTGIAVIMIILNLFNVLGASFVFFFMIFLLVLVLIIYALFSLYYELIAGVINSNEIKKIKSSDVTYEYYLKNETINLSMIEKNYSNDPFDAIREMVLDFNFATSLDGQLKILDELNYLIKNYDKILFQNQLFNKYEKLFDYETDPIAYMNNMKKFYNIMVKNVFIKKKDLKELNYFMNLLSFSVGYEKKIYEFEKNLITKVVEREEISSAYKEYKVLEELVKKQIVVYKNKEEMGNGKGKYKTEDEYFEKLVGNLLHDNKESKKRVNKFTWLSFGVFSILLVAFILLDFANIFSIGALIVVEFLFVMGVNLYEKTKNVPYFNLYVALEKEVLLKYNFLGKYVVLKNEKENEKK